MSGERTQNPSIEELEARLAGILAIAADAILSIDDEQRIVLFNDGAEAIFGWRRHEVLGQSLNMLIPARFHASHPGQIRSFGAGPVNARRMGERQEIFALHKDGREFPAEASIAKLQTGNGRMYTVILRDVSERRRAEAELARSHAELETRVAERTEELRAEIRRRELTQAQLVRTQRMEAFGQLTGGIAHDFNNLLTVITGNLELLEMRLSDEKDRTILKRAQDASEMGARLTSRLLTFARRRQFEQTSLNLNDQLLTMVEFLQRALGETINLTTRLSPHLWRVRADASEIENAVLNLAINARDAMPKGGQVIIETMNITAEDNQIGAINKLPAGDYVRLTVSDTGSGMTHDVIQRAFEPFFTTKSPGKGTGLGLSTIYGFVQQHGGTATIYSEEGQGTTVNLYLPRQDAESDRSVKHTVDMMPVSAGETVLVVEDNAGVRDVARQRLEALGYKVVEAESGPAALAALQAGAVVDIVFSDVVMAGGMSGFDVARAVNAKWPSIRLLLASGYAEDVIREQGGERLPLRILRKPYSRQELARAIRDALDGDESRITR